MSLIPLVAVVGPTASGKTKLAIDIALKYGGEVVSADSMQIYKGMDIGTAKPDKAEMRGVPHHLIDFLDVGTDYSVAQFVKDAHAAIQDIHSRGKLPVVAGGTGLYIDSLLNNIKFDETVRDDKLRADLEKLAAEKGGEALLKMLESFDPETASTLHPNNIKRIIRAIEVYKTTGKTMTEMRKRSRQSPQIYKTCFIGLNFKDRAELYRRVEMRVDLMMERGLEKEVRTLLENGADMDSTAMQAIGYKEIAEAISKGESMAEAAEKIKLATRHYAKRQLTWFRRNKQINWIEASEPYEKICQAAFEIIDKSGIL
ncbi:tRNA dimethylallyltransferase [[Clostridium] cellulosi]|uniref:tRNA dimethylallyltransferase n=1 Tax=[Clostridium] cellulosi TaxID=29343 RepID=A0A078KU48_9FIRM|nr:tRNA dimethylallyltransferase [[Clostridium] cellulosi]